MKITDCARGDLVVIVWPMCSDTGWRGQFSDFALQGREVLVQYGGPALTTKRSRNRTEHAGAFVTVCDWDTMQPSPYGFRCVANVEIVDVVESRHRKVDEAAETSRAADELDPFAR